MYTKRAVISGALACALSFGTLPFTALGEPASNIDEARATMESYGQELAAYEDDLANASQILEETKAEIDKTQDKIEKVKSKYNKSSKALSDRVRADYRDGNSSILDIIFGSTSIEDLVSRVYYLSRMNEYDLDKLEETKELQDELVSHMAKLEERKAHCEKVLSDADATLEELNAKLSEAQEYFNALTPEVQGALSSEVVEQLTNDTIETNDRGVVTDGLVSAVTNVQVANFEQSTETAAQTSQTENASEPDQAGGSQVAETSTVDTAAAQSVVDAVVNNTEAASATGISSAVDKAYDVIGTQYSYGGMDTTTGFDCSGLVNYAYGSDRGRSSYEIMDSLKSDGSWKTSVDDLEYGDLVFPSEGHVAIYIGNNQIIHAPMPGQSVTVSDLYGFIGGGTY